MADKVRFNKELYTKDLKDMHISDRQVCIALGKSYGYINWLKKKDICKREQVEAVAKAVFKPAGRYCIELEGPEPEGKKVTKKRDMTADTLARLVEAQVEMTRQVGQMAGAMAEMSKHVTYIFNEVKNMRVENRDFQKKVTEKTTSIQTHVMRTYEKLTHVSDKLTAIAESLK